MTIAITGASGHIGACLCHLLLFRGYQVKVLAHKNVTAIDDLPIVKIWGDITNEKALDQLMDKAEVVVHLAARIAIRQDNGDTVRVNAEGTKIALEAALRNKVRRFIHFSSIHTFNPKPFDQVLNETRALVENSPHDYDTSKILSESYVRVAGKKALETIIFCPTAVMGPYDSRPSLLGKALIRFFNGENPALIPGGYNWVDVRDVGEAVLATINGGMPGEKYILSGEWISIRKLADSIEQLGGAKPPRFTSPFWLAQLGTPFLNLHAKVTRKEPIYTDLALDTLKNSHRNISSKKAEQAFGYKARPFEETLHDTIDWFQSLKLIS